MMLFKLALLSISLFVIHIAWITVLLKIILWPRDFGFVVLDIIVLPFGCFVEVLVPNWFSLANYAVFELVIVKFSVVEGHPLFTEVFLLRLYDLLGSQ